MHIHIGQTAILCGSEGMDLPSMIAALAATGMTYADIGEAVGVSQPTISRWAKGSKPDFEKIEAVRSLLRQRTGLTNETRTSTLSYEVAIRGELRVNGSAQWYDPIDIKVVSLRIPTPEGSFAFIARDKIALFRARTGDIVLVGAAVPPHEVSGREALVDYEENGESHTAFALIHPATEDGIFLLFSGGDVISKNARISKAHPYLATFSGDGPIWIA